MADGGYIENKVRFGWISPDRLNQVRLPLYRTLGRALRRSTPPRRILILSHMRAGSTLLSEVISAHPSVLGFGELFLRYEQPRDLWAGDGKIQLRAGLRPSARGEVILDKLLHDYLSPIDVIDRLEGAETTFVFLVRSPDAAVPSMMSTFGSTLDEAVEHYLERVATLAEMASVGEPRRTFAVTFDDLTERADETLDFLSGHLDLDPPLTGSYSRSFRTTGDVSTNLASGRILAAADRTPSSRSDVPDAALTECRRIHEQCVSVLAERCVTPSGFGGR